MADSSDDLAVPNILPMRSDNHTPVLPSPVPTQIAFNRVELNVLFSLYGRKVAAGEWRDYALDFLKDRAVFSVFRRATEYPLYRIEKMPKWERKQGAYAVITPSGHILKRGHELARVLAVLDRPVKLVTASI